MRYYEYSGPDSGSDSGTWKVVIAASNEKLALRRLLIFLNENGRSDLIVGRFGIPLNVHSGPIVYWELES